MNKDLIGAKGGESAPENGGGGALMRWLDRRTGIRGLLHHALDEPIPGGAKIAYVFGSGLLFLFISQAITGIFLALYYVPSADHAHTTVAYISKEVSGGSFLRSVHAYGSSAIVIVLLLHIAQTFFYGSYKGRRELLWLAGCVLLALMLGMAFTGYLLPWDQKAYFATTVGTNILSEIPGVGNWLKRLLRGGTEMGTLTLSRFYVFHVFMIPAFIFIFVAIHLYLFRKAGAAGPVSADPIGPSLPAQRFYPRQVVMDMVFTLVLIAALGTLAHFLPMELGPKANPADTLYLPRPEWYYLPAFQWLKYWQGPTAVVGILIIPALIAILFVGLPFFDRGPERRPWKRPLTALLFTSVLLGLALLGIQSVRSDARDPAIAAQMDRQRKEVDTFMKTPFEPELSESTLAKAQVAISNPLAAKGKTIYEAQGCDACHGSEGVGTDAAPKLTGVAGKYQEAQLIALLKAPNQKMKEGGMEAVELKDDEMAALVAYLLSLKATK